jgi:putative membrane protein
MNIFSKIIIHILSNAIALYLADKYISGISFSNENLLQNLLLAGVLLGLTNAVIKPIIKLFSFPFIILTFGLFLVIINIAMLLLVSSLMPSFSINSLSAAFWGTVIVTLVNYFISAITNNND